jgi:hypothetical protein
MEGVLAEGRKRRERIHGDVENQIEEDREKGEGENKRVRRGERESGKSDREY